jgi:hypothetical protein
MLGSDRNRGVSKKDDPWDDDGFLMYRKFKHRNPGKKSKRLLRRVLRRWEIARWRRDLRRGEL